MVYFKIFLLGIFGFIFSTNNSYGNLKSDSLETITERLPIFLFGGEEGMYSIINKNIKYPKSALNENIQGKVIVQFVVDTLGKVNDFQIIKSVRDDVDEEALRVTRMLDKWEPATQNGKKVKVVYSIPITFSIQQNPKKSKTSESLGMVLGAVLGIALVYGITKIFY
ncbi:MAG: hypothetical protein RL065_2105 [Bacteroidota bacterium]|jgi:TonB family protein